jgi:hypothetical protein
MLKLAITFVLFTLSAAAQIEEPRFFCETVCR